MHVHSLSLAWSSFDSLHLRFVFLQIGLVQTLSIPFVWVLVEMVVCSLKMYFILKYMNVSRYVHTSEDAIEGQRH